MRILYFDCFSGISGDMTLAALVDAGADRDYITDGLAKLPLEPYSLEWKRVVKNGISSIKLDVIPDPAHPPKHHRHYTEIAEMIRQSELSDRAKTIALSVFETIGKAEAKIHHVPLERVHFHEVGAVDSIVDIVGAALAIDSLDIDDIYASAVPLGSGKVRCDHGIYPVPAPATLEMMKGWPIAPSDITSELTTPTGAGIVTALAKPLQGLPAMTVDAIGYGAGTKDFPQHPNVLRCIVGVGHQGHRPHHHHHAHHHAHGSHHHEHNHDHDHHHDHDHDQEHHHDHDQDHDHDHHHDHHHDHDHGRGRHGH